MISWDDRDMDSLSSWLLTFVIYLFFKFLVFHHMDGIITSSRSHYISLYIFVSRWCFRLVYYFCVQPMSFNKNQNRLILSFLLSNSLLISGSLFLSFFLLMRPPFTQQTVYWFAYFCCNGTGSNTGERAYDACMVSMLHGLGGAVSGVHGLGGAVSELDL